MDIFVDIREFLEIHVWIFYGFSDQGWTAPSKGKAFYAAFACILPIQLYAEFCEFEHEGFSLDAP